LTSSGAREQQQQQASSAPNSTPASKFRNHIASVRPLHPSADLDAASNTSSAVTQTPVPQGLASKQHKTLLLLTLPAPTHSSPGALASALAVFKPYGLNLTSINTRPSGGEAWTYVFFIEVLEVGKEGAMEKALEDLRGVVGERGVRNLGGWEM